MIEKFRVILVLLILGSSITSYTFAESKTFNSLNTSTDTTLPIAYQVIVPGKHANYNFNYLFESPNVSGISQSGTIEYHIEAYDPDTKKYTVNTISDIRTSGEGSKHEETKSNISSPIPEMDEFIIDLIDTTIPGTADIDIKKVQSGAVNIGDKYYPTDNYQYLITKKAILDSQTMSNGTVLEPVLVTKITGEKLVLTEAGIVHTFSFKLDDASLTGINDQYVLGELMEEYGPFIKSLKQTNFKLSVILTDTDVDLGTSVPPPSSQTSENKGGGCLIATAAFGSELAPQVQQLRETRDSVLFHTASGSAFMTAFNQAYYTFSPTVADWERQNPVFKEMVKVAITPLITTLSILNYVKIHSEAEMLGYGIGIILLNLGMYFTLPVVAIVKIRNYKIKQSKTLLMQHHRICLQSTLRNP